MMHLDPVEALAIAPDGKTVATATGGPIVTFWNARPMKPRGFATPPAPVERSPSAPTARRWPPGATARSSSSGISPPARERATLTGHDGPITCVAFAPDGKTLASGSRDASVTLWDVAKAAERANPGPAHQRSHVRGVRPRWRHARHRLARLDRQGLGRAIGRRFVTRSKGTEARSTPWHFRPMARPSHRRA